MKIANDFLFCCMCGKPKNFICSRMRNRADDSVKTRNGKAIVIGIAVGIILIMVNPAISPAKALYSKSCSTIFGFKYYDKINLAESVAKSQMMVIGTITNVETKVVDNYQNVPGPNGTDVRRERAGVIPWKFVTLDIEKYLFDKTGKYSDQITFRTPANECVDTFDILSAYSEYAPGTSPQFNKGDKSLIEINSLENNELYSNGGYKFDIIDDKIQPNEKIGVIMPISLESLEAEIIMETERQGFSLSQGNTTMVK